MKQLIVTGLLGLIFFSCAYAQIDSSKVQVLGYVYDQKDMDRLTFVHIVNIESGLGVISDTSGFFKIKMTHADTLLFQSLGYESKLFSLPDSNQSKTLFVNIAMAPTTFKIREIDIMALSNKSQFKHDFIHLKTENNTKKIMIPGVTKYLEREERVLPVQYTAMSPITALYYSFSKKGKSLHKYMRLLEEDAVNEKVAEKYNEDVLFDLSRFSEDTLQAFYKHLDLSNQYILKTDEYNIYKRVLDSVPLYRLRLSNDTAFFNTQFDTDF